MQKVQHRPTYTILLDALKDLDAGAPETSEPEMLDLGKILSKASVTSLESISEPILEIFRDGFGRHPGLWQAVVEDHYIRESFARIPGMVKRIGCLTALTVNKVPSSEVQHVLAEATRCFIYGFLQSSVALLRAALELGFNERLRAKLRYVPNDTRLSFEASLKQRVSTSSFHPDS